MKKRLIPIITLISISGCSNEIQNKLSIITPVGAPALAFYNMVDNYNFETNSDASSIMPMMKQGIKDIVVLPTNIGVNAIIKQQVEYKIAATITFGNLFIASTGNDDDGIMNKNDYIVLFQQNSVPDLIFHSIYGDDLNNAIHYVGNAQFASQCLLTGKNITSNNEEVDYVLIAEPSLTTIISKKGVISEYANLQELYKEKYGVEYFQASIFVKNGVDATNFLSSLEEDINKAITNPNLLFEKLNQIENSQDIFGVKAEVAKNITANNNRMGLGFKLAKSNKKGIDKFLSIFGIDETNEEIYY